MSFIVTPKAILTTSKSCVCEDPSQVRTAACDAPETTVTECRKVEFHHHLIEAPSARGRRIRHAHDAVVEKVTTTVHVVHHHSGVRVRHCRRTAAAAAAAVGIAVVAVGKWNTTCKVLLSVLSVFPCSRFSLSPPASFPVSHTARHAHPAYDLDRASVIRNFSASRFFFTLSLAFFFFFPTPK